MRCSWLTFMTDEERRRNPAWPPLMNALAEQGACRAQRFMASDAVVWVAAERRALFEPLAAIRRSAGGHRPRPSRRSGSGHGRRRSPNRWALPASRINIALAALEAEGFAMRGRFAPGGRRRRMVRTPAARAHPSLHGQTAAGRNRARVKRGISCGFCCEWQRVLPEARMQGADAVAAVLAQLEGFEAPAGAWETEIIPARMAEYEPQWLDEHCRAGRFVWTRLAARTSAAAGADAERGRGASPVRSTPITLLARRNVPVWAAFTDLSDAPALTSRAASRGGFHPRARRLVLRRDRRGRGHAARRGRGCARRTRGARPRELRQLRRPACVADAERPARQAQARMARDAGAGSRLFGMADAGRWALVRPVPAGICRVAGDEAVEHIVRTLLRRWGVIFWKLLDGEADWLPPWRDILMCCRRLEARGEIRGGRFVAGFSGEQYATPEAIGLLREVRRKPRSHDIRVAVGCGSAESDRHHHAGREAALRWPAIGFCIETVCRSRRSPRARSIIWKACRRTSNGRRKPRYCAGTRRSCWTICEPG